MPFHSQFNEDRWITRAIKLPEKALFCDVGAYDGVASSNTLFFEEDLGWRGILIEPSLKQFFKCQNNRQSACLHFAIGTEIGNRTFYLHPSDPGRGSLLPIEGAKEVTIWVTTLEQAWKTWYSENPYLLSIDTEGTELDVWASRGDLNPEIVIIEYLQWGSNEKKQPICQQLDKDGYKVVSCTEANLIFVKK